MRQPNSPSVPHLFLTAASSNPKGQRELEFLRNSKIPYRDPRVKPEDDIVGNSKIPNLKFHIEIPKGAGG